MTSTSLRFLRFLAVSLCLAGSAYSEFHDDFEGHLALDPLGEAGWAYFTGDGTATMEFVQGEGFASMKVDATSDRRGIWWALIKRDIAAQLDLEKMATPGHELHIEARVRSSSARKRVNLHFNTQRTTDFHSHLLEFDLPEAGKWFTISMTTHGFDARPGDHVFAQLAMMDWGLQKFQVDIDYLKAEVVDAVSAPPNQGDFSAYHPPVADPRKFHEAVRASQDAVIDRREPTANLRDWSVSDEDGQPTPVLTVNGTAYTILRFDLSAFKGKTADGSGQLELTTYGVQRRAERTKDFGMVRLVEVVGGDENWNQNSVTYDSLSRGQTYEEVFNTQMIIDEEITDRRGDKTRFTIARPALQRLLDGSTKGLLLIPLGSINAAFYSMEQSEANAPVLRFNVKP